MGDLQPVKVHIGDVNAIKNAQPSAYTQYRRR